MMMNWAMKHLQISSKKSTSQLSFKQAKGLV